MEKIPADDRDSNAPCHAQGEIDLANINFEPYDPDGPLASAMKKLKSVTDGLAFRLTVVERDEQREVDRRSMTEMLDMFVSLSDENIALRRKVDELEKGHRNLVMDHNARTEQLNECIAYLRSKGMVTKSEGTAARCWSGQQRS